MRVFPATQGAQVSAAITDRAGRARISSEFIDSAFSARRLHG